MTNRVFKGIIGLFFLAIGTGVVLDIPAPSAGENPASPAGIYSGDSVELRIKGYVPSPSIVPYGRDVKGVYFDGYPQIVKEEGSKPVHKVRVEKDIMVAMRDGVRIAVDVYPSNPLHPVSSACFLDLGYARQCLGFTS
jgi:hypothetical protein